MKTTYVHTNLVAKDWRKLAQFYIDIFDCEPVYPERDLSGEWIDNMTGITDVHIEGIHLRLPGAENGPTLEIFGYNTSSPASIDTNINDAGFGHIAFHVENVEEMIYNVIAGGGSRYGALIEKEVKDVGKLKAIYVRDPEGNIIEIQHWEKP
jgi:catechol 2,3-dioxygenase-like lactoylglutathione lyase family enzyme